MKSMKKAFKALVALLTVMAMLVFPTTHVHASDDIAYKISVEAVSKDEINVKIIIPGGTLVSGGNGTLEFDTESLTYVSRTAGSIITESGDPAFIIVNTNNAASGSVRFSIAGAYPIINDGVVTTLKFSLNDGATVDASDFRMVDWSIGNINDSTHPLAGSAQGDVVPPASISCPHETYSWKTVTEATCTTEGVEKYTCDLCGHGDETRTIPTLGHTAGEWQIVTEATCAKEGVKVQKCTVCGEVVNTETIPALGHDHTGEWTVTKQPTCTEPGIRTNECSRCDEIVTEEIPALGHDWSEWEETTPATCEDVGEETRECTVCGATETREIAALGHNHDDSNWVVKTPATCTKPGIESNVCTVCGEDEQTREIPATGHIAGDWEVIEEPTCETAGTKVQYCAACNEVINTEEIPALGHEVEDDAVWVVDKEPTCAEPGYRSSICSVCGEVVTEEIPALGHDWSDWSVVKQATTTEEGLRERTCLICGEKETEVIDKLPIVEPGDPTKPSDNNTTSSKPNTSAGNAVKTDDNSNVDVLLLSMTASIVGLLTIGCYEIKKRILNL